MSPLEAFVAFVLPAILPLLLIPVLMLADRLEPSSRSRHANRPKRTRRN
jgi:hypothetical protein